MQTHIDNLHKRNQFHQTQPHQRLANEHRRRFTWSTWKLSMNGDNWKYIGGYTWSDDGVHNCLLLQRKIKKITSLIHLQSCHVTTLTDMLKMLSVGGCLYNCGESSLITMKLNTATVVSEHTWEWFSEFKFWMNVIVDAAFTC